MTLLVVALSQVIATVLLLAIIGRSLLFLSERLLGKAPIEGEFAMMFASLAAGIVTVVFSFSVLMTNGQTSSWATVPPILAAMWAWPRQGAGERAPFQFGGRAVAFALSATLLAALWSVPTTMTIADGLRPLPRDDAFYVSVVESLLERGVETTASLGALLPGGAAQPSIYHYFDLWLGGFLSRLWDSAPMVGLRFHADVVLLVTVMTGMAALMAEMRGTGRYVLATALWLPFMEWWLPSVVANSPRLRELGNWQYLLVIAEPPKLLPGYMFATAVVLAFKHGNWTLSAAAAALSACANISLAPLFLGVSVGAALGVHNSKGWSLRNLAPLALAGLGPTLFLAFFQFTGGTPTSFAAAPLSGLSLDGLRISRNIIAKSVLYCIIFFGPPVIFGLGWTGLLRRVKTIRARPTSVALLLTIAIGLAIWALLHRWPDSVQFFMNPTVIAGNLACLLALAIRPTSGLLRAAVGMVWALSFVNWVGTVGEIARGANRDAAYLAALQNEAAFSPRVGGFIISTKAAHRRPEWELFPPIMTPGSLSTTRCCVGAIPLVDLSPLASGNAQVERGWRETPFVRFSAERSLSITDPSVLEEAQLSFVIQHGLRFVVLAEDTDVPDWVARNTERSYSDSMTGERFHVLRTPLLRDKPH